MKVAAFLACTAIATICGGAGMAYGDDANAVGDQDRSFANYTRDAATVGAGAIRLEVRGFHSEDRSRPDLDVLGFPIERIERNEGTDIDRTAGGIIDLLGSVGFGNNTEVGFDIPGVIEHFKPDNGDGFDKQDIGDISMYAKFKYKVADHCHIGAGLDLSLPTGPERKYLGTGELGANPFVSTRYQYGIIGVGGHVGYYIYTGHVKDVLNYSGDVTVRANSMFAFRLELSGRNFKQFGDTFNDVVVLPGIDFDLAEWLSLRPVGMFNLTPQSHDWGVGIGVATRFQVF